MEKIFNWNLNLIQHNKYFKSSLLFLYKALPLIFYICFSSLCFFTFFTDKTLLVSILIKATCTFLLTTLIRITTKRKRPFERYDFTPIIKHNPGTSFPSKHASSSLIISLLILNINTQIGVILVILSLLICLNRFLFGIHFISDLLAGYLIAIMFWAI